MRLLVLGTLLVIANSTSTSASAADLVSSFKAVNQNPKGAFGKNILQGPRGRRLVLEGVPAANVQFQAAYRNEAALALAQKGFYVGNLFTTNYYELMGEYVFGDAFSNHPLDHAKLIALKDGSIGKASAIIRHWVLEKQYVQLNPTSNLAKGFRLRGVSGSEFETEYARYFFNYYLSSLSDEADLLPALLLSRGSPIAESNSLEKARNHILQIYEWARQSYGERDPRAIRLYQLRNLIHNQLSESVIGQLDGFTKDYPNFAHRQVTEVRGLISAYYAASPKAISSAAVTLNLIPAKQISDKISAKGATTADLFELSRLAASLREYILNNVALSTDKKSDALVMIIAITQYLNKEMLILREPQTALTYRTLVNVIYAEGFLLTDNWRYFDRKLRDLPDAASAANLIPDVVSTANDTLAEVFGSALTSWVAVDPKMKSFVDNILKSSAVNTATLLLGKVKK